jgi:hypothetical protein
MTPKAAFAAVSSRLRFLVFLAGWPGAAGLALILAAGIVQLVLVPREAAAVASARAEAERQHQLALAAAGEKRGAPGVAESLANFRASLKAETEAGEALEILLEDAKKRGLPAASTEYKWQRLPAGKMAQVQVTLPLKGGYGPLRGFLQDVFADLPGLALDQFDLQRDNIANPVADARLRFTLYLRAGS